MRAALDEARLGLGRTHPNPPVGAVIARKGVIVGRGHHQRAGEPHAEIHALREAGPRARGAELFVTLEPCNHHGRTPPCTEALLEAGVKRVFFGSNDPNPRVDGHGARTLQQRGVESQGGLLGAECDALIEPWVHFITTGLPWVVLKAAITLDGKLATRTGDSKWISSEEARALVHEWRNQLDAVLVGAGTVRADDPRLTVRGVARARNPVRVVLGMPPPRARLLREPGETVISKGPLKRVLRDLAKRGLTSVLVEGGAAVHGAFLKAGLWDELRLFVAPKLAGEGALSWAGFPGVSSMDKALHARIASVAQVGPDLLVIARPMR